MDAEAITVRTAEREDRDSIISLAVRALGWRGDERDREFFRWKHDDNPFGPSPAWVALQDGEIVGFRTFLRWELARGSERLRVVRAVDTASDPDHQGRGIFRRLTLEGVSSLSTEGYDAVFNTPNEQSRPGYLKMGWKQLGRPTLGGRPRGLAGVLRMTRSHQAAEKWSEETALGEPASEALHESSLASVLRSLPPRPGWATPHTAGYLQWRYGFEPLKYRVLDVRGGLAVFRVRRRGAGREVALCEWLAPGPDRRALRRLLRAGDYVVGLGVGVHHGLVPLPGQGPIVTWRPLARSAVPALESLAFSLGDIELM